MYSNIFKKRQEAKMRKKTIINLPKMFYVKMIPTVAISGIMSIVSALFIRYQLNETSVDWQTWLEAVLIMTIAMIFQYYRNLLPARDVYNMAFSNSPRKRYNFNKEKIASSRSLSIGFNFKTFS